MNKNPPANVTAMKRHRLAQIRRLMAEQSFRCLPAPEKLNLGSGAFFTLREGSRDECFLTYGGSDDRIIVQPLLSTVNLTRVKKTFQKSKLGIPPIKLVRHMGKKRQTALDSLI